MLKTCCTCGIEKPLVEFNRKSSKKRHSKCRPCSNEYSRKHYQANKQVYAARRAYHQAIYKRVLREIVKQHKDRRCDDCGLFYPLCAMNYDHRPGVNKITDVSTLVGQGVSIRMVLKEIRKCDVVCANCHASRTFARRAKKR